MSDTSKYDLVVIGAGSGGVRASRMAAATGARVAVIEDSYLGGTCVNVGCVPKKLYVYASQIPGQVKYGKGFGIDAQVNSIDWATLKQNKDAEIQRLNGIYKNVLEGPGVEIVRGTGRIISATQVEVVETSGEDGTSPRILDADRILIATGGQPFVPEFPGSDLVLDSDAAFAMTVLPKRMVVVGGGYIAVEFAGIFNGLGCETKLIYRGEQILRGFDEEIRGFVSNEIRKAGVDVMTDADIERIEKTDQGLCCYLANGTQVECDGVMYATGRRPRTDGLGLEKLGVETRKDGTIIADDHFKTSIDGVFALGDVIGTPALTPVALEQGMVFVNQQFGDDSRVMNYDLIPTAVFCQPNIATVGLTEEQATDAHGGDIDVYTSEFRALKHTLSGSQERTLMKLIVRRSDDGVIGAHMVGDEAGELVQGIAVAMQAGATKAHFDRTIGIHPTGAEEFVTMRTVTRQG
ncbi:MAG: glutathione-disulfide reductase [Pseudomonas sp.]|nr:glutathione-disulfide reductase [Pseudomonas sp.]